MEYFNVINSEYKNAIISKILTPCVKVELIDWNGTAYKEIIQDLSSEDGGSISATFQNGVQRSITLNIFDPEGKFIPDPNNRVVWIGQRFKVYLGLRVNKHDFPLSIIATRENDDFVGSAQLGNFYLGEAPQTGYTFKQIKSIDDFYWFSKGVYIINSVSASRTGADKRVQISGVDKFGYFTSDTGYCEMIGDFIIYRNTTIEDAIYSILGQEIGNGNVIDTATPIIDPYYINTRIPMELSKGAGSFMGDIITDLANTFRADVYYDNDGHFCFKRSMLGDENMKAPIVWNFNDLDGEYLSSNLNYNFVDAINTVYVVGDNPKPKVAPVAFRQNTNAASPTNVQKLGARSKLFTSSVIQNIKEAEDYADYMLEYLTKLQQSISFTSTYMPHLEINQAFTLTDNFYHVEKQTFLMQSITYPIGLGNLSIGAVNIEALPTYGG